MNNSATVDKIRKLLRLGQSSNPHEAAAAIARAFEIARKHQIDLESVNIADDEELERLLISMGSRLTFERLLILNIVKRFFRVEVVVVRPNVAFIGRATDVAIAHYAHDFLLTMLRAGVRTFQSECKRKLSKTRKQSYVQGWIYGVARKLESTVSELTLEDSRMALVPSAMDTRIRDAARAYYPETKDIAPVKIRRDRSSMVAGYTDGKRVEVRQPLTGPAALALPLGEKQMSFL